MIKIHKAVITVLAVALLLVFGFFVYKIFAFLYFDDPSLFYQSQGFNTPLDALEYESDNDVWNENDSFL